METGKVLWFNKDKRYGFVKSELNGEEYFFHFSDGEFIIPGKRAPTFSGQAQMIISSQSYCLRDPQRDDLIKFDLMSAPKGWKAKPWGYQSHYDNSLKIIANRPAPKTYRVLETMNNIGKQPGEPEVLWEGSDLEELLKRYPVPSGRQSPGSDPLLPYFSDLDNIFETRHWFEQKTTNGWEKCPDPRPLSGCNRQFERITNRW